MKSLLFILALIGSTTCVWAQKGAPLEMSSNIESSMDLTPEQIEAILQIENEFAAIQRKKKEENPAYKSEQTMLIEERELKLKKILSPSQWGEYQKMQKKMSSDPTEKNLSKDTRSIKGQKLKVID